MGNHYTKVKNQLYSYEVDNTGVSDISTPHYRSIVCKNQNNGNLIRNFENISTCHQSFLHTVKEYPNNPCIGKRMIDSEGRRRDFEWETYKTVFEKVKNFGAGLRKLGALEEDKIGIFSPNRPEWIIALQACYAHSFVSVPVYDTLDIDYLSHIVNHAEIKIVICSSDKIEKLIQIKKKCPTLSYIISMDDDYQEKIHPSTGSVKVYAMTELLRVGNIIPHNFYPPTSSSLASICYTGGVTDEPKGVMITHGNLIASISACRLSDFNVASTDVYLSYLPLAHMYERMIIETLISRGASIGFYGGNILNIMDDICTLEPTLFASVPRVLNKIQNKLMDGIYLQGGLYQNMFDSAYSAKLYELKTQGKLTSFIWDQTVFNPIKKKLGGRIRLILSGSAPLNPEIGDFFRITMSCSVIQGYGLTETTSAGTCQLYNDTNSGNVGIPLPCCEIKLVSVPENNYSVSKSCPEGEICIRGPNLFVGYYKQPEKTESVFDEDGWFHTGDIGTITNDGKLCIIDRMKNIVKLSNGTFIGIEEIESAISKSKLVHQVCVQGEYASNIKAVVVPNFKNLRERLNRKGNHLDNDDICLDSSVKEIVMNDIQNVMENSLSINDIYLDSIPFSEKNGLLTPTMKLRRCEFSSRYKSFFNQVKGTELIQIRPLNPNKIDHEIYEKNPCTVNFLEEINAPEAPVASSFEEDSDLEIHIEKKKELNDPLNVIAVEES